MKVEGLVDATYFIEDNIPNIVLVSREDGEKKIQTFSDFRPYVYVEKKDYADNAHRISRYVLKVETPIQKYIKDEDREIFKLTLRNPFDVYEVKKIMKTFEGDILFPNRFLIDRVDELTLTNYRVNFFDIETTSEKGFPNYLSPNEKIISIASYDNYEEKYKLWIWHDDYINEELIKNIKGTNINVKRFPDEKQMLESFINYVQLTQPDYLVAWNVAFDIRYLVARCERLNIDVNRLSPLYDHPKSGRMNLVKWHKGPGVYGKRFLTNIDSEKNVQILGLKCFDLLMAFKAVAAQEYQSWALDFIAEKELGINKLRTHFDIGKVWKDNPEFIEDYNYVDVYLIKELDKKMQLMTRYNTIKNTVFLFDINDAFASGRILDNYVLKKYKDKYIFPTKVYDENRIKDLGGGFVRLPEPGLRKNVAVLDFSGFYPNLMKTFNLSGDVLIKDDVIFLDKTAEEKQEVDEIMFDKMYSYNEENNLITYKIRTSKFKADLTYSLKHKGVMAESVNKLMELRKEAKKEMKKEKYGTIEYQLKDRAQFSYKFIINAAYGTSAYPGFRLYSNSNANAITAFARMISKWVSYKLDKYNWKTLTGDTDSLFIQLNNGNDLEDNLNEVEEAFVIVREAINEFVEKFLPKELVDNHTLEMDTEKIYKTLLLLDVKKRYIGLLKYYDGKKVDDKLHYMGIDSKKSNTIEVSKEGQLSLAMAILREEDIRPIFQKYYDIVKTSKDINMFKLSSKLEKHQKDYKVNTPAVRASLWSNKNIKTKFRGGTKFFILYVVPTPEVNTDVIAFEEEDQINNIKFKINKDKYLKDLFSKFDNLIRGISNMKNMNNYYYLKFNHDNKTLEEWF